MFVFSVKTSYKQLLSALACVAVIAVATVAALILPGQDAAVVGAVSQRVTGTEERIAYLRSLGYEAAGEEVREVRLPDEPDEVLEQYNALLEQAGMSLSPYYGKRVRLYTYEVTNAAPEEPATAHLYVYRDRIIAGDVSANAADGTMKPLM